jgi:hypothetical protein
MLRLEGKAAVAQRGENQLVVFDLHVTAPAPIRGVGAPDGDR